MKIGKHIFKGLRYSTQIIFAFVVGQVTQLVLQAVVISLNLWDSHRIPFCSAAGFIVLFAVIMGAQIASRDEEKKSYKDYADGEM